MITYQIFKKQLTQSVINVILPIQQQEFSVAVTIDDQPDLLNIESFYQSGKGNFWVAQDGADVVGTLALLDIGNDQSALRKMFVKKEYRGKALAIAQNLLSHLVAWGTEQKLCTVFLGTTDKYHAAHRFYDKNGFVRVNKSDLPAAFPVMEVDTIFYSRTLE